MIAASRRPLTSPVVSTIAQETHDLRTQVPRLNLHSWLEGCQEACSHASKTLQAAAQDCWPSRTVWTLALW